MNRIVALAAAAIAGLVIARRKTLKEDTDRVKAAASESAAKLNERVRDQSSDDADEEVISLVDGENDGEAQADKMDEEVAAADAN